jgi:hypothetical protein
MDDMSAFERQVVSHIHAFVGPSRPVNDAAIFTSITTTQSPRWKLLPMFSPTKFVVASAILAVFGGLLLAGLQTRPSDHSVRPAAASPSASPDATTSASPEATIVPDQSLGSDLLPGVDLVTEEVEPGVYKVLNDGARDLAALDDPSIPPDTDAYLLVVDPDGGVWTFGPDRDFFRLGDPASHLWTDEPLFIGDEDIEIAPDGTVWSAISWRPSSVGKHPDLMAYDGASWTDEGLIPADEVGVYAWQVEVGPDGSVWALESTGIYMRESAGWIPWPTPFEVDGGTRLHISDDGTRWLIGSSIWRDESDWRDGEPNWEEIFPDYRWWSGTGTLRDQVAISPNGTLWVHLDGASYDAPALVRLEHDEWTSWSRADGVPPHILTESWTGQAMAAATDGSVWLVPGDPASRRGDPGSVLFDLRSRPADGGRFCKGEEPGTQRGVSRFDGTAWTQYLAGRCVHALAVTPDGTAWLRASDDRNDTDSVELYAIRR